jgi:hypothetical protein
MARKKQFDPVTISAPSGRGTGNVAANAVDQLAGAAATSNTEGGLTQLGGFLQILSGQGGALAMDPTLRAEFDNLTANVNAAIKKPTQRLNDLQTQIATLQSKGTLKPKEQARLEKLQAQVGPLEAQIAAQNQRLTDFKTNRIATAPSAQDEIAKAFPELRATADAANPYLDRMGQLGATGERLMGALGQGFRANEITGRDVGRGAVGESLYSRAAQMAQSDGRLSPEANRDAVQAARQAFAARGLGTSAGSAAAELLNRDQYSRQRMFQDLGFASGVQEADVARQTNNANRALQSSMANEEARRLGNQMNIGMLGQAFTTDRMVNQEGLGAVLQRGQLQGAANPNNMLMNLYNSAQPVGSQAINAGAGIGTNWANNQVQTDMFNANAQMWGNMANQYGNYGNQQSGAGSAIGGLAGMAAGAGIGALLAAPTGGMSLTTGALVGAGVGGGFGSGLGGLFGR